MQPSTPTYRQRQTLLVAFARQHARATDRELAAGATALATHLDGGARLSDALIAADRAVGMIGVSRGFRRHRRTARGRAPADVAPAWLLILLAEQRLARSALVRPAAAAAEPDTRSPLAA